MTGWQDIDGKHLYFTDTSIYASNGIYSINGKNYLFEKGQLVKDAYGVVDKPGLK